MNYATHFSVCGSVLAGVRVPNSIPLIFERPNFKNQKSQFLDLFEIFGGKNKLRRNGIIWTNTIQTTNYVWISFIQRLVQFFLIRECYFEIDYKLWRIKQCVFTSSKKFRMVYNKKALP